MSNSVPSPSSDSTTAECRFRSRTAEECSPSSMGADLEVEDPVLDEIFARLEELKSGATEPLLSEEELRFNDQLQQDELLALEAIYGSNVVLLEKLRDTRILQINVVSEIPYQYNVSAELNFSKDTCAEFGSESSDHPNTDQDSFLYTFNVQYLPPLLFTCLLPVTYPSHSSPHFTIYAEWLNSSRIQILCHMLDKIWVEYSGQEVLYQWIEWLHVSALSYLNFDGEVRLGPYDGTADDENRNAISGSVSPDVDILHMIRFNEAKCAEIFLRTLHVCCICFSEYAGAEFVKLPCKHRFCSKCMETYVSIHVRDGSVFKLVCPEDKCNELLPPGVLKVLLGNDAFERWESMLLQRTLDSMDDLVYCPRCDTPCLEDEGHDAQCSRCLFSFCTLCKDRRHVGGKCMAPEMKLHLLEARQKSGYIQESQKRKELEIINNILSLKEILRDAKQCPRCKMAISRIEGCNKMKCKNCEQFFCYLCSQAIDGYDHFKNDSCQLFDQEAIEQWEQRVNDRRLFNQNLAVLNGIHYRCGCGQDNPKIGDDNHIFCWSCRKYYCALCLKRVPQRASLHFRWRGCKKYTRD